MGSKADIKPKIELTEQQITAVDLLATGSNLTAVAEKLGVARQTVSEWRNHHAGFIAQLNLRRQEIWCQHSDKLRALIAPALDALESELLGENRLQAALAILKLAGSQQPTGSTDPHEVARLLSLEKSERDSDMLSRELLTMTWNR